MTVFELSEYMGINETTVRYWISKRSVPRLESMASLAAVVDMDVKKFIEEGC